MIIPKTSQKINIGDKVIITREIDDSYCIIMKGHEFDVIGYDNKYNNFICEDKNTNFIVNLNKNILVKKINLKLAEKEYIFNQETLKYKEYIFENCPNSCTGYTDRDIYHRCLLKKGYDDSCDSNLECAKFLKIEDINKCYELVKHLRKYKLDKIKYLRM